MSGTVIVHKGRNNRLTVNLGIDITGDTITSEIRTRPEQDAPLVATWTVTVDDATTGEITLTMNEDISGGITVESGWMDFKHDIGGEPWSIIDEPIEVSIRGTVTA